MVRHRVSAVTLLDRVMTWCK